MKWKNNIKPICKIIISNIFIAVVILFCIQFACFCLHLKSCSINAIFKIFFIAFGVLMLIHILYLFSKFYSYRKLDIIRKLEGFSPRYFDELNKQINKIKFEKEKQEKLLLLASAYGESRNYEKAFEIIKTINIKYLSDVFKAEYYNAIVYFYLRMGQIENAKMALKHGENFIEKYRNDAIHGNGITHTLAVFEYAQENYQKAESMLLSVKSNVNSKNMIVACDLFLGLIYLKTNRKEYAKKLVSEDLKIVQEIHQKEDLIKLMRKIEIAYSEVV